MGLDVQKYLGREQVGGSLQTMGAGLTPVEGRRIRLEEVPTEQSFRKAQPVYCEVCHPKLLMGRDVHFARMGLS